jgi:hypothetical protein
MAKEAMGNVDDVEGREQGENLVLLTSVGKLSYVYLKA